MRRLITHTHTHNSGADVHTTLRALVHYHRVCYLTMTDAILPLRPASIWRHDDAVFPLWNIFFDPLEDRRLCVQVVYSDVEEALEDNRYWFIHLD